MKPSVKSSYSNRIPDNRDRSYGTGSRVGSGYAPSYEILGGRHVV